VKFPIWEIPKNFEKKKFYEIWGIGKSQWLNLWEIFEKMLKVHTPTPFFFIRLLYQIFILPPIGTLPAGSSSRANIFPIHRNSHANHTPYGTSTPSINHAMYWGCPIQKPCQHSRASHSETMPTFQMIQNIQNTWHGSCSIHFPCQGSPHSPHSPRVGMAYAPCNSHANVCEPPTLPTGMRHGEVRAWFV